MCIPDSRSRVWIYFLPGSGCHIQDSKKHWIRDLGSATLVAGTRLKKNLLLFISCKGGRAGEEAGELHHRHSAETAAVGHSAAGPREAQETGR
jgi:hypothetical protein